MSDRKGGGPAPKGEMSSLDVRAAVRELRGYIGSRVDKAYETSPGELLVRLRGGNPPRKLEISILVGKALHLTTLPREAPEKPTSFVMQLRKHLSNAFVDDVRQHGFDRIVELVSNRKDGRYVLVVELFHDGNVVLVKDDRIVTPLMHQSWATREVRPGVEWVPPPARADPATFQRDEFLAKMRASNADAVRTLATEVNLGGTLDPVVIKRGEDKIDVSPFPLRAHEREGLELVRYPTFHEALDAYFGKAVTVERVDPRLKKLAEEKAKVQRMLDAQVAALVKFEREEADAKRKGDLLYGHFDVAGRVAKTLWEASKGVGWKVVQEKLKEGKAAGNPEALLVEGVNQHEGTAILGLEDESGKKVKVRIDLRKSVQENADDYYELSKKMREKRAGAIEAKTRTEAKMKELDERGVELVTQLQEKQARKPATKRFWFENYRWFFTSDGHLVMAGRDVRSNEKLVSKQLEDNDRYLHADVSGAPSCVVKAKDGTVSDAALEEAAAFAVCMSRVWTAGHAQGEAYWVTPQQVSKTPNPGEYVAKGAFIIRGKRNFIRGPARLAIGEVELEGHRKIMGGPVAAIASRSKRYVVVEPGQTPTNQLANELADAFDVNVEEVQGVMPPSGVRVVERVGL